MPDTGLKVILHASAGRGSVREFPVAKIEAYAFEAAMDVDTDSFSIDIGDPFNALATCTHRDTEVRATIYAPNVRGTMTPVFSGIADKVSYDTDDFVLSINGSDNSSLANGDVPPGRWRHVKPADFIKKRAQALGMQVNRIHEMAEIGTLYTDGSETEWAFWYRLVRSRGMFMWTEPLGGLVIDHLGYALRPTYQFGHPPHGAGASGWIVPDRVNILSSKQRQGEVWVYAEDSKSSVAHLARGIDTSIKGWKRKPIRIVSSTTAKSQKDAQKEADVEVYESIVGAQEVEITINDVGLLVKQNTMARINMPEIGLVGNYYVVAVQSKAGMDGKSQTIRLREKDFALSKRVPAAPDLSVTKDTGEAVTTSSISAAVAQIPGIRWSESFVRATREFGSPAGWDTAVFLAALLAICEQESHFHNVREGSSGVEWASSDQFDVGHPHSIEAWHAAFANAQKNSLNPRYPSSESGVGPMQLTTPKYKEWADAYGWNGQAKSGEYDGGRWNTDSNIRAAARALVEKGQVSPAVDPTHADQIWIAVARYHGGSTQQNADYVALVKGYYKTKFSGIATAAVAAGNKKNVGGDRDYLIKGHGTVTLPAVAPDEVVKALNFCMNRRGDGYKWGGGGPLYDCSSLVTAAYASASAALRNILDVPHGAHHGENTYSLFTKGRFTSVTRDNLLAGDLLFFNGPSAPEHVGMYIGDGMFVHDSNPQDGVKVSSLSEDYYTQMFVGARRLVNWGLPGERSTGN